MYLVHFMNTDIGDWERQGRNRPFPCKDDVDQVVDSVDRVGILRIEPVDIPSMALAWVRR